MQLSVLAMKGWMCDISKVTSYEDLPSEAKVGADFGSSLPTHRFTQAYLRRIEELMGVPISWVGVGAGRTSMLTKGFEAEF